VTLVQQSASRNEVLMAFDGGWGWKDRKYVLTGNNGSGTLEITLTAKQSYDGFMVCDAPFCSNASPFPSSVPLPRCYSIRIIRHAAHSSTRRMLHASRCFAALRILLPRARAHHASSSALITRVCMQRAES
jgi:hypothetical protein